MINRRRFAVALAILALVGGFWQANRDVRQSDAHQDLDRRNGEHSGSVGRGSSEAANAAAPGFSSSSDTLKELGGAWQSRYPEAELVESRLVSAANGTLRLQQLLRRQDQRMPWILWEEKIEEAANGELSSVGSIARMANVFLVDADPDLVPADELSAFLEEYDLYRERESRVANYLCLGFEGPALGKLETLLAAFRDRFPGAIAEFETLNFPSARPSDWDPSRMWGLDQINALDAWDFERGQASNEVVVAIIDTGMQRTHPDLAANLFTNPGDPTTNGEDDDGTGLVDDVSGWDFYDDDADPQDNDGHGTHVAGIAGAVGNNGSGAVGVNWGVRILPLKVGDRDGLRTSAINDALAYVGFLKQRGINIVATNNSYGSGGSNATTKNEITKHRNQGILFVAASGNDGKNIDATPESLEFPAGYDLDNIISVGNSNQEDLLNASSNYGEISVDISAPGSEIYSTYPGSLYEFLSGTSMASPMVAGAVALLAQANPNLTASQLKARLMDTGDPLKSQSRRTLTGKRLNLLAALRPELSGHFVEVTNVRDTLVLLDGVDSEVVFEVDSLDGASLGAEVVSGAEVGELQEEEGGVYRFVAKSEGNARLRFSATLSGIERSVEKTVFVGQTAPVLTGLTHHYAFEGSGSVETDLAGGSNGSIAGATRVGGVYGRSLELNASNEQMTFNSTFSDRVTIAALVRSDDMSVSPHPRIVHMPFYYLYFSSGAGLEFPDGNRQTLKFFSNYTSFGVWNAPPRSVQDGSWYYVVGTYDSRDLSNTPQLYINGQPQAVRLQQPPQGSMVRTGGTAYVGNSDSGDRAFAGLMADIRIYDRELSSDEVAQLGAALTQARWNGATIDTPAVVVRDEPADLSLLGIEDGAGLSVDWYVETAAEANILAEGNGTVSLSFGRAGTYEVRAQVSDGVATRVVAVEVEVREGRLARGHYIGTGQGGGLAWLEVDESLQSGYATVFDPESGFYRIRELVTFAEDGSFSSLETSIGRIQGLASGSLDLRVPGYSLEYSGEFQVVPVSQSSLVGSYRGGGIGSPGDTIRGEVLPDGRVFFWREGPFADLLVGAHDREGGVSVSSALGRSVELTLDETAGSAMGRWGDEHVFLKNEALQGESFLMAGAVGGYPNGSGPTGLYAEFIGVNESANPALSTGGFSVDPIRSDREGPFVLLSSDGTYLPIGKALEEIDLIVDTVAAAVASGELSLAAKRVAAIRSQVPVFAESSGLVAFSVVGAEPLEVLVRGLGPSFAASGAEDPKIAIYRLRDGAAETLAPNDNWRDGALFTALDESPQGAFRALASGFEELQLTALADEAKDAAQRVWLEPGDYLVLIQLANGAAGSGLIEVLAL